MNPETNTNEPKPPVEQPAAPNEPTSSASVQTPDATYPPRKSNKKVILIIVGVIVALALAGFLYFTWLGMQVLNASNKFMDNITTGKVKEAAALTDGASESYLNTAATATKGSYERLDQAAAKAGNRQIVYILYSLDGASAQQARTALEKKDGKWKVIEFVYGKDLKLVPDSTSDSSKSSTSTQPAGDGACLVASDFDTLYQESTGAPRPATTDYTKIAFTGNFHFNPDSLEFSAPTQLNTGKVTYFANFIKQNEDKDFTVHLKGRVATTKPSDLDFARQRAEKVKNLMVAQGADASHIVVDEPGTVDDLGDDARTDSTRQQMSRSVVLTIDANCTSATGSGR